MAVNTYDEVPYPSASFPQTHPLRLATMARLFGLNPASPSRCRVLELGCADGANLLPLAEAYPESSFLGLDLSLRQIESGRETIREAGLSNVRLEQVDLLAYDPGEDQFDYIIAHGLYSWVPDAVRERILALCQRALTPLGVAYISYNTLPGWHMRGMIRHMTLYHASQFDHTAERVAQSRALVRFLADSVPTTNNAYGQFLQAELAAMEQWQDGYLRHDLLEDENRAFYFHDFIAGARRHGLQYLSEPDLSSMLAGNLAPAVQETLASFARDLIALEQYMDFLRNRSFRMTLLVREGLTLVRGLDPRALRSCWFGAAARPESPAPDPRPGVREFFRLANGTTFSSVSALFKAMLCVLHEARPNGLTYDQLQQQVRSRLSPQGTSLEAVTGRDREEEAICQQAMVLYGGNLVEVLAEAPAPCGAADAHRPRTTPLMRHQARHHPRHVTNLRHLCVPVDGFSRQVIELLDGHRDRAAVTAALVQRRRDGVFQVPDTGGQVVETDTQWTDFFGSRLPAILDILAQRHFLADAGPARFTVAPVSSGVILPSAESGTEGIPALPLSGAPGTRP